MSQSKLVRVGAPTMARRMAVVSILFVMGLAGGSTPARAQNEIVTENALPGNPQLEWDVPGAGDLSIQGFATDISVDQGESVQFKIDTDATAYHIDIYRLGWYGGDGARKVATVLPSATLPQAQPAPLYDAPTGLTDCGNWAVSASWAVPPTAVSGIYIARLVREDTDGASHIIFIVRDDDGESDLLFQTGDATWQAYNTYGGNGFYSGGTSWPSGRAVKVSYNRPFIVRAGVSEDWVFNAEFPMLRWLERNGYDVSYTTNVDTERLAAEILDHKAYLSVGHDEYWSAGMRNAVTAARDAGVHLAFFSGNEIYWKTRYEPSSDGTNTPYRTLVCYKEGPDGENACPGKCDPDLNVWTGLWRGGCPFTPPADGCSPENALSGQISWDGSTGTIEVPGTYAGHRFWRNSAVAGLAPAATLALTPSSLGYEWDPEQFPASYPPGRVRLSMTQFNGKVHHLSLDRAASGALVFGAGTVQWSWGLDGTHDRGSSTPHAAMRQATVNLLADMGAQPATLMSGLVAATPVSDVVAPVSTIGFPVEGASVPAGVTITISGTSLEAAGVVAGVEVSTDGGTTWNVGQGGANWSYGWTPQAAGPVTLLVRAVDDFGNLETPDTPGSPASVVHLTVTGAVAADCPCTIWPPDVVVGGDPGDTNPIEIGVRFRSDEAGAITGARFYKHLAATESYVAHLWTNTGTLLATAPYTDVAGTGWKEVAFDNPVAISANTTYVISTFMPVGHYAFSGNYFSSSGFDRAPLHALQSGIDGANGVYLYGASGFPTGTFNATNYWVDVVFDNEGGPDVTAPTITAISPGNGASSVSVGAVVSATFSEAMAAATITGATVELRTAGNALVPAAVGYDSGNRRAVLTPSSVLDYSSSYTARVLTGITDLAGNPLGATLTWSFSTAAPPPPPPTEGPGGPILVVSSGANPFSRYPVEILRAEGLNSFTAMDLSLVSPAVLDDYDVVVLGECALDAGDVTMLSDWTTAGGTLIAFRPDLDLASLLGLTSAAGTLANGYLLVDTASGPGVGIVGQTMQFHGTADLYTLDGATALATLYSNASTATAYPAVTLRSVGGNGGQAACFTYDLARSVVYTRQGNPAWAGQERDGITPKRSDDLYFDPGGNHWVDLSKVAIPQADEQQRLLANMILAMSLDRGPLPRFWYFPNGEKAVVVMTGDDHGSGGTVGRFQQYETLSPVGCSAPDWECIRGTSYIFPGTPISDAQVAAFQAEGFEIAVHVDTGCGDYSQAQLEAYFDSQFGATMASRASMLSPATNRNHCIAWSDWATQAKVSVSRGVRLDTNYYYWPPAWVDDKPGMFTGSGMPMRFADSDGTLIDCYQVATQMTDESGQSYPATPNALLDRALGADGYYGAFCANMHTDAPGSSGSDAIISSALTRGVPVVSARQMLTWLDGRNGSSFGGITWAGNELSFSIAVGSGANNLRAMLPLIGAVGQLDALTRDGNPVAFTTETIKGIQYAFFPASPGAYAATYLVDEAPPVLTAVTATPHSDGTATIEWTSDEASDSHVDYGTAPGALTTTAGSNPLVTAHSVTLGSLLPSTTYHFRVRSADVTSNLATEPPTSSAPLSFAMPTPPCFQDATAAEFGQGTTGAGTAVSTNGDGQVTLAVAVDEQFSGVSLPAGWVVSPWTGGGSASVGGGVLTASGAAASTSASYGPGGSLEFVATFLADPFQNVGLANGADFGTQWVTFGTGNSGAAVYARTLAGDVALGSDFRGAPHRYRIDWTANGDFKFYVDDVGPLATIPLAINTALRPIASDYNLDGSVLVVDELRLTPYAAAGSFTSRVFDSGGAPTWGTASWTSSVPVGTSLAMFQRQGATPTPDGTWTPFNSIPSSGSTVGGVGRYIQYRADLATSNTSITPVLDEIEFACSTTPDVSPPVISSVVATPGVNGTTADIGWTTDEPATSRVDYGTSPGALSLSASAPALVTSHALGLASLAPSTTYYYRVTSVDGSTNSATDPESPAAPRSFTTAPPPPTACAVDATAADFAAGTHAGTLVMQSADGEVTLSPGLNEEFTGVALPAAWAMYDWPYDNPAVGTATVGGGLLTADGARVNPEPFSTGSGVSLEFVATFSGAANQHIGFGAGSQLPPNEVYNTTPWAMFSTHGGGTLKVRTHNGGSSEDFDLGGSSLGSPHLYRIDWESTLVRYWIDGVVVRTAGIAVGGNMRPAASDLSFGGGTITVDWMRMTPYVPSGTFTSRVFDAGSAVTWDAFDWTATTPAGTALALSVRTGDDPDPGHVSWSAFQPIGSGQPVGACARYLQYRAQLSTSDGSVSPELADVTVLCTPVGAASPIADLASGPAAGPPNGSGRRRIALTWSDAGGGGPVHVYRKGHGDYPLYRVGIGVMPTAPATPAQAVLDGWTLTAVTASGQEDEPATRDFWHYVAFNTNACGGASSASNLAAGRLDYVLGDFSDGLAACAGDNVVNSADLSLLGASYGAAISGPADPHACMDIGPSVGYSTTGRPLPDGVLDFEDLVLCALNYDDGGAPLLASRSGPATAVADDVQLRVPELPPVGGAFVVPVWARGGGRVHALHLELDYDATVVTITGVESGALLGAQAARSLVLSPRSGRIDVALLGGGAGLDGEGELVLVRCLRIAAGDPGLGLASIDARDGANRRIDLGTPTPAAVAAPLTTRLAPARPNPFRGTVALAFTLAEPGPVDLALYSVDGRRVRTLLRGAREAGEHTLSWDGRDDAGAQVSTGVYYVRLLCAAGPMIRTVTHLK